MRYTVAACLVVMAVSLSLIAGIELGKAQDSAGKVNQPVEAAGKDAVTGTNQVRLAHDLAEWGRDNHHPGALAVASAILDQVPLTKSAELAKEMRGVTDAGTADGPSGKALLAEAKEMVKDDVLAEKVMEALTGMGMKGRGATNGAIVVPATIPGPYKDAKTGNMMCSIGEITVKFKKGELAAVWVGGEGNGEVDLYILDSAGNIVTSDETAGDSCWCDWTPKAEADYIIAVVNRGQKPNAVVLVTN